ncbi:MAG: protein-(glutamine-N5) methyltransferase, ribosomal protein L3-specific [Verrucomicrobia bacterium]|nr:protein-(glutamine-N5) methyltransferase, ribosomal protein L3-specific [Verrucomicrobiota bacterium]
MTPRKNSALAGAELCGTLGDWLHFATKLYRREKLALGQVADSAHDEALYLLLRTLGLPLDSEPSALKRKLTPEERDAVEEMLHRRAIERVPAAYLTHEAWLGEQRFYVDERVIIPRSYFLEIIPEQLDDWIGPATKVKRVADVCTGSGCLAVLLAQHFPSAKVDAMDLSADALAVAKINLVNHQLTRRVALFESDVFDAVPATKYDVILSNPPYEPSAHVDRQSREFKAEPRIAHDGGKDGLVIIRKLLRQAKRRLTPQGIVLLEVGGLRAAMDREFKAAEPHWLHTQDGSNCICVIQAQRLGTLKIPAA